MAKFAAFVVSIVVSVAAPQGGAVAASAEAAIKGWIAAVPASAWTLAYKTLAYNAGADRTLLTGFTATSADKGVTISFDTIAITGYTSAADGSFVATTVAADGGKVATEKATVDISDVGLTDLGVGAMPAFVWDSDHPFTSIMRGYAGLTKVSLAHGRIGEIALDNSTAQASFSYRDLAIDGWKDGRIAAVSVGDTQLDFIDEDSGAPVAVHVARVESRDTDINAVVHVYSPDSYANGVGDMEWRQAIGSVRYDDISVTGPGATFSVGAFSMEDMKVRQPQRSFAAALDTMLTSDGNASDLPPEVRRAALDMASAFSIGRLAVTDVNAVGDDGSSGYLGAYTMTDYSLAGLGEIAIEDLSVNVADTATTTVGRLAVGGLVFPSVDEIIAAMDAEEAGEDVDFNKLRLRLGYIEAADIDVDALDMRMLLDRLRLDLKDYVGVVPGSVSLDVAGLDLPTELLEEADVKEPLLDLGYDRLRADYGLKLTWHEADATVTIDELRAAVADAFSFSASAVLIGVKREDLLSAEALSEALTNVVLVKATATVSDPDLFNRWIAQQAWMEQIDQKAFRAAMAEGVPDMLSDLGDQGFRAMVATALQTFIVTPGSLTAAAEPADQVPVSGLVAFGGLFPSALPEVLGLTVTAVAGPEPTPYDYVPRETAPSIPDTPSNPGGGPDRHVPFKK